MGALREWLSARWPFSALSRLVLDEEIPGGASFCFSLGSAVLTVFFIQALTGVMQLFFYVPSVRDAYRSVGYLHTEVPFGWLIHGLHFWGAQVIIVLMFLHIARVFIWGAYKRPRELTWLAGVALLLVLMAFSLTGATLPWDQKGYWAGQVSTSVAGIVPFVGKAQKVFLRGGQDMGQLTITRFFGLHVALLPMALAALFSFHIVAMRRFGSAGPWDEEKGKVTGPFWPDQVLKDAIVATVVFLVLLTLVVFVPYQFSGPADPFDASYVPKPEWNFLFLYESLKYLQGPLEPLGAAGIPGILIGLLVLLPFIDRSPERDPFRRPLVILSGFALAVGIAALSIAGYLSPGYGTAAGSAGVNSPGAALERVAAASAPAAGQTPLPVVSTAAGDRAVGADLFGQNCSGCHGPEGRKGLPNPGSAAGRVPELNPIGGRLVSSDPEVFARTVSGIIHNGSTPAGPSPALSMPSFDAELTRNQIEDLVTYIMALNGAGPAGPDTTQSPSGNTVPGPSPGLEKVKGNTGDAAYILGNARRGLEFFRQRCTGCHGEGGKAGIPDPGSASGTVPALDAFDRERFFNDPVAFAEELDRVIQHGSVPQGSPAFAMPAFGDDGSLTQPQIANLISYIMSLNGVDRSKIVDPGMTPGTFYVTAAGFLLVIGLVLAGAWTRKRDARTREDPEQGEN